ncbi:MAG: DUF3467 domain-containing protein [Myxococcales bacterium]|nr:MAG: DUF3467 domain-containing protein [Myxococcales bacterium]
MTEEKSKRREIKLEIVADEAVANGVYANFIIANHSESEFMLDFIFVPPQAPKAKVLSRVVLSPAHAKRLNMLMGSQIAAYEKRFGEIRLPVPSQTKPKPEGGKEGDGGVFN